MSAIIDFFSGDGYDDKGRHIYEILEDFGDEQLESCHDYIQWLFPLPEPSKFNPTAPLLSKEDIEVFRGSNMQYTTYVVRANMGDAFNKMMCFFDDNDHWVSPGNHNFLRITRMLRCLRLVGFDREAKMLFDFLCSHSDEDKKIFGDSMEFWRKVMNDPVDSL